MCLRRLTWKPNAMPVSLIARHSEGFDILGNVDPVKSPYVHSVVGYASKVRTFYAKLQIESALWTFSANYHPPFLETGKEIEYLLAWISVPPRIT